MIKCAYTTMRLIQDKIYATYCTYYTITVICYVCYKQFSMAKNKQEIKKKINLEEGSAVIQHGDQNFQSVIFS